MTNAQFDLMAGRTEVAARAIDRLTDEIDEVLNDLEEARIAAEIGEAAEAICRLEKLLHPSRAAT